MNVEEQARLDILEDKMAQIFELLDRFSDNLNQVIEYLDDMQQDLKRIESRFQIARNGAHPDMK